MIKRILRRFYYLVLLFGFSLLFASLGTLLIMQFRVNRIELVGTKSLLGISSYNNAVLFLLNTNAIEKDLLRQNASINSVYIQKKYPKTLRIEVTKSPAVLLLRVGGGWYMLDVNSKILKKSRKKFNLSLPVLEYFTKYPYEMYKVGDSISSKEIQYGVFFAKATTTLGEKNITVAINHLFVIVLRNKHHEFWFTTKKSKENQVGDLVTIVRGLRIEGKKFKKVDVRFSKPVVELDIYN